MAKSVKEAVHGDYRDAETRSSLQYWLRKIEVLRKHAVDDEDINIKFLEKALLRMLKKSDITMQYIMVTNHSEKEERDEPPFYSVSFKDSNSHQWIGSVFGCEIYEVYAKSVLFIYSIIMKRRKEADGKM